MSGDEKCPLCGTDLTSGRCERCGHLVKDGVFGDSRDDTIAAQSDFKKMAYVKKDTNLRNAIIQLEEAALSSPPTVSSLDVVSSSLLLLNIPLEIETKLSIQFNEDEIKAIGLSDKLVNGYDVFRGSLSHPPEIYIRLGNAFFLRGKHSRAKEYYDKALLRNPGDTLALYNRAVCLFVLSRYEDCLHSLDKLLSKDEDYEKALHMKELALQMRDQ